ncbi:hypothetical protein PKOR_01785 [Pontibacter korlensis]|uniref:Uncharacterized protein n=1 Tax=Pontibacter korlensis TaxID=400092 RepID=A0A0E3UV13_9BACT|nr:hypothetical protein [Pontibacter korlensis]AKD02102.1 hypothetical protein PKOR_01785 [Pontibacter korlensis]
MTTSRHASNRSKTVAKEGYVTSFCHSEIHKMTWMNTLYHDNGSYYGSGHSSANENKNAPFQ